VDGDIQRHVRGVGVVRARTPVTAAILAVALGVGANLVVHRVLAPPAEAPHFSAAPPLAQTRQAMPEPDSDGRVRDSADAESEDRGHAVPADLKRRPFSGTESFVREVLANPENPTEVKVAMVESLEDSTPEAIELLLETAAEAEDPELRAAAVESLAWLDKPDDIQGALLDLLETESSAEVRAELYSALAFDPGETYAEAHLDDLVRRVLSERRSEARVQGFRLVASMLRFHPDPQLAGDLRPRHGALAVGGGDARGLSLRAPGIRRRAQAGQHERRRRRAR
jgi:hypothetical protein